MNFRVGEVLGTTVRISIKRIVPLVVIALIYFVPIFLLGRAVPARAVSNWYFSYFLGILLLFVGFLGVAAPITYGVVQELKGRDFRIAECLAVAGRRLVPVCLVIVILFLTFVAFQLVGRAIPIVGAFAQSILLPIALVRWAVAVPAAVMERAGGVGGLARSAFLTKGRRWRVFGLGLLLFLVPVAFFTVVAAMAMKAPSEPMPSVVADILAFASVLLFAILHAVLQATTYYRLRQEKEGLDTDDLAEVFE